MISVAHCHGDTADCQRSRWQGSHQRMCRPSQVWDLREHCLLGSLPESLPSFWLLPTPFTCMLLPSQGLGTDSQPGRRGVSERRVARVAQWKGWRTGLTKAECPGGLGWEARPWFGLELGKPPSCHLLCSLRCYVLLHSETVSHSLLCVLTALGADLLTALP